MDSVLYDFGLLKSHFSKTERKEISKFHRAIKEGTSEFSQIEEVDKALKHYQILTRISLKQNNSSQCSKRLKNANGKQRYYYCGRKACPFKIRLVQESPQSSFRYYKPYLLHSHLPTYDKEEAWHKVSDRLSAEEKNEVNAYLIRNFDFGRRIFPRSKNFEEEITRICKRPLSKKKIANLKQAVKRLAIHKLTELNIEESNFFLAKQYSECEETMLGKRKQKCVDSEPKYKSRRIISSKKSRSLSRLNFSQIEEVETSKFSSDETDIGEHLHFFKPEFSFNQRSPIRTNESTIPYEAMTTGKFWELNGVQAEPNHGILLPE